MFCIIPSPCYLSRRPFSKIRQINLNPLDYLFVTCEEIKLEWAQEIELKLHKFEHSPLSHFVCYSALVLELTKKFTINRQNFNDSSWFVLFSLYVLSKVTSIMLVIFFILQVLSDPQKQGRIYLRISRP